MKYFLHHPYFFFQVLVFVEMEMKKTTKLIAELDVQCM